MKTFIVSLLALATLGQSTQFQGNFGGGDQFHGAEPAGAGTYPVYIYITGTTQLYNLGADQALVQQMANRGYVAATVQYNNGAYPNGCGGFTTKAARMFGPGANTALSKVCARAKADCSKGVAVHGFSQGANLASMADQLDSRVTAALMFGNGDMGRFECMRATTAARQVGRSKRRSIVGSGDVFFGFIPGGLFGVQQQQKVTSGYDCGWGMDCIQADGSGYYITNMFEARVDHCFFYEYGNCWGALHAGFQSTNGKWGMKANLDWLAGAALVTGRFKAKASDVVEVEISQGSSPPVKDQMDRLAFAMGADPSVYDAEPQDQGSESGTDLDDGGAGSGSTTKAGGSDSLSGGKIAIISILAVGALIFIALGIKWVVSRGGDKDEYALHGSDVEAEGRVQYPTEGLERQETQV